MGINTENNTTAENVGMIGRINAFFETHQSQKQALQAVLIDCAIHTEKHGDVRYIAYLVQMLEEKGQGLNSPAVCEWINAHTKAQVSYDAAIKKHVVKYDKTKQTKLDAGKAKPWYEFKKPSQFVGFDNVKALQVVIGQTNKAQKKSAKLEALAKEGNKEAAEELAKIHIDRGLNSALLALLNNPALVEMVNREYYKTPEKIIELPAPKDIDGECERVA